MDEIKQQLDLLSKYNVECVIIGGVAAVLHGSSTPTFDHDVCYARDAANLNRLAEALTTVHGRLRGAPAGLPFTTDAETLRRGLNFTFDTDVGPLDLLGEIAGVGGFPDACTDAVVYKLFGHSFHVHAIGKLIAAKRASERKKDLNIMPELEAIREHLEGGT